MRLPATLLGAGLLAAPPALAAGDLGDLLSGLAPDRAPSGTVAVTGWVEGGPAGTELVVRLEPQGAAKLVAEPGVTVTPVRRDGLVWPGGDVTFDEAGASYFATPVELRLPFSASADGPVEAAVEYAYCLVDYQCLFGETVVRATSPACVAVAAATAAC